MIKLTKRKKTKEITIGELKIGGNSPILIQTMTSTQTDNINKTVDQIKKIEKAGCFLIRLGITNLNQAKAIKEIKKQVKAHLVGDIHFDYRLAIEAIKAGVSKIRFNPGNIGSKKNLKKVIEICKKKNIPIRIGVNSGSIEKSIEDKYKSSYKALVESALKNIRILEKENFTNIVVSLKHSNVIETIKAYKLISEKTNYPLHLGVTEAGTLLSGSIKSSIAIGNLLLSGIGDTFRVSISEDPVKEILVAKKILKYINLNDNGVEIISCPTCSRCNIDVINLSKKLENKTIGIEKNIRIAIMGCLVNGPGEAKNADIGICGIDNDNKYLMFFKKGKLIKKIPKENVLDLLLKEIKKI